MCWISNAILFNIEAEWTVRDLSLGAHRSSKVRDSHLSSRLRSCCHLASAVVRKKWQQTARMACQSVRFLISLFEWLSKVRWWRWKPWALRIGGWPSLFHVTRLLTDVINSGASWLDHPCPMCISISTSQRYCTRPQYLSYRHRATNAPSGLAILHPTKIGLSMALDSGDAAKRQGM